MSLFDKINQAASSSPNMNDAQSGGGTGYTPPAAGLCRLRFVGYIELGTHKDEYKGEVKTRDKVRLIFELSGPKHPPRDNGSLHTIEINETLSLNEKANFYKLFKKMNYEGKATHMAQLLGQEFIGTIVHVTRNDRVYANLKDDGGYTIAPPYVEDADTGERRRVTAEAQKAPTMCFLWNFADKEQWDSIYIDGQWDAKNDANGNELFPAKSKNKHQLFIQSAVNWMGSPMQQFLEAGGTPDLPPVSNSNDADPLANVA